MGIAREEPAENVAGEHDCCTKQGGMDADEKDEVPEQEQLHKGTEAREKPSGQQEGEEHENDGEVETREGKDVGDATDIVGLSKGATDCMALAERHSRDDAIDIIGHVGITIDGEHTLPLGVHVLLYLIHEGKGDDRLIATLDAAGGKGYAEEEGGEGQGDSEPKGKEREDNGDHYRISQRIDTIAIAPDKNAGSHC